MGGLNIKYLSLITLVFQNSLLVLIMRYSRTLPGPPFRASVAVAASEIIKFSISLLIYIRDLRKTKQITPSLIAQEIFGVNSGWLKMTVPAILYLVQNNLQYIAVTLLDAATFQVTYQMKIITTAMFSVLLLNRQLSRQKWVALCILTAGIAIVQLSNLGVASAKSLSGDVKQQFLGLLAVGAACTLSGLAGVWFERELKGSSTSLFLRNVQLSLFSVIPALIGSTISFNISTDLFWCRCLQEWLLLWLYFVDVGCDFVPGFWRTYCSCRCQVCG